MYDLQLLNAVNKIAIEAGGEILEVYNSADDVAVTEKHDNSPITEADRRAHSLIVDRMGALTPDIPLLSEESDAAEISERRTWSRFWLVDPLDGTKEFIDRNGQFTVNIALIEQGRAVAGVVYVPVSGISYMGGIGIGAWKKVAADNVEQQAEAIQCRAIGQRKEIRVVASTRHRGARQDEIIQLLGEHFSDVTVDDMGSSLKMCLLAEGSADIYPRFAPCSEWDTAAAHAILSAAGGEIVDLQFEALRYNAKEDLLNPSFIALADPVYPWRSLLDKHIQKY